MIAAGTIATIGVSTYNALNQPNAQDKERFAKADAWYSRAIQGDAQALCYLQFMGGRRGSSVCGGDPAAGFATQPAKDYCEQLYQQALKVLAGTLSSATPTPKPPAQTTTAGAAVSVLGAAANQTAQNAGNLATALGQPPQTNLQQKLADVTTYAKWAFVGVGVLGLVYLVVRARR